MDVTVLGPVRVFDGDREVDLGGPRNRALVARLALDAGRPVGPRTLIDGLWGAGVPADATNALQSIVSRTRRRLPDGTLRSTPAGYILDAHTDLAEFRDLAAAGRVTDGLALWTGGEPLADVRAFPFADPAAVALTDERLAAVERQAGIRPSDAALVAELAGLTRDHPHRDGLWLAYLRALVATGRPSEALAAYEQMRQRLADDLGVDPSPDLQDLHLRILRGERIASGERLPHGERLSNSEPAPAPPHVRLPAALTSFIGREDAVAEVRAALTGNRLVTILGPGGAGKTRLAVEAARAEPGEVWFAELAPLTGAEDLAPAVLAALGLVEVSVLDRTAAPRTDPRSRLMDAAGDLSGLLVLDNCEHLVEPVAALAEEVLLRAPRLRVLTTSREALRIIGEVGYQLGPLAVPPADAGVADAARCSAIELFVARARAVDLGFDLTAETLPAVREIVLRLDGQPLAIELAAARLRTLTAAQVAARLSDRFRLLTGGSRTALPRHRTLRAVVEWSWDLLADRERDLAERIAVFPGGVTVGSAAAVFDGADDTADLLDSLADKSLLVPVRGDDRFRMLETLREYGAERLVERGVAEKVRSAHLDYFVQVSEDLAMQMRDSRQVAAIRMLDTERGNLTAAMRFAIDRADRPRAARLVRALSWYWMIRNQHLEVDEWVSAVLALPGSADPGAEIACTALGVLGRVLFNHAERDWRAMVDEILRLWDEHRPDDAFTVVAMSVLEHFGLFGDRTIAAQSDLWTRSMLNLVRLVVLENAGRAAEGVALLDETVDGFRACGDGWGLATVLGVRGMLESYDGEFARAIATWQEAVPLLDALGAEEDAAYARLRIITLQVATAGPAELAALRRDLVAERDAAMRADHRRTLSVIRLSLGQIERNMGDPQAAVAELRSLLADLADERYGGDQSEAMARALLGGALAECGDLSAARAEIATGIEVGLATRDMPVLAIVAVMGAAVTARTGDPEQAARLLGAADAIRGRNDRSNSDAEALTARLREGLGAPAFAECFAAGAGLDRAAAVELLRQDFSR